MPEPFCGVAIMAKASVAGAVKTRLVPPLTYQEAAELNTCCFADIATNIAAAAERTPIHGFVAYHPLGSEQFFENLLPVGFKLLPPKVPTLGRSLYHAARDLFGAGYASVCLVNGDSPTLPTERLVQAARHLWEPGDRLVLGPAADGGYYLIGMKQLHERLFEEIDWSTDRVYRQTVMRADEIGLPVAALAEWYDVDDEASLSRLARELLRGPSAVRSQDGGYAAPRTTALLKRLAATNSTVRRLLSDHGNS
jgi:rSAM/selenodomain-associated transferase 1